MNRIEIKKAIVSVSDKTHLEKLLPYFLENKIKILSTGGTFKALKNLSDKLDIQSISEYTGFPEILDGRVKTLHPSIHSGILADKLNESHKIQLKKNKISTFDLVIVNLYPFQETIENFPDNKENCIENIDIGGPTIIRASAKNFKNVVVLSNPDQYVGFISSAKKNKNIFSLKQREEYAREAFALTANYESVISNWFLSKKINKTKNISSIPLKAIHDLRYGENPHQNATLYSLGKKMFNQISGKSISYNNILDFEVANSLVNEFSQHSCVIAKHGNPCGVACSNNQITCYQKAFDTDRESAFGGIIAFNKKLEEETAKLITNIFTEIVIAPTFSKASVNILKKKKNLILIESKNNTKNQYNLHFRSTRNFLLVQNFDSKKITSNLLKCKTKIEPNHSNLKDLVFSMKVARQINSNAIVLAENQKTLGLGIGQTSRLKSTEQAIISMKKNIQNIPNNIVMASDGFFPFPDIIDLCSKNGIKYIIQPGGSINDKDVIIRANEKKISLLFTGIRHFKH